MPAEPFTLNDASRVVAHPDTPAAYIEWVEILPLTGAEDRTHLGNLLGWSHARARKPVGASRELFEQAWPGLADEVVDEWMARLGQVPVQTFLDHYVPFLRNSAQMEAGTAVPAFLSCCVAGEDDSRTAELRRAFPASVHVEITRSCNYACTMCSSRTGGFLAERTMPLEVFGEIVRVFAPHATSLRVNGYGESSIVPGLGRYLDCLDEFGFAGIREIVTNLSAADTVYRNLWERGFVLMVSWDAAESGLFERIRVGADYGSLLRRLRGLGRDARAQPERLILLCTVQEANLMQVVPVVELAAAVGSGVVLFNMVNEEDGSPWMDRRIGEIRSVFEVAGRRADELGVQVRIPDHVGRHRMRVRHVSRSSATFCDRPWREIMVRWDTEATVCNMFNPFSYGLLAPPGPAEDTVTRFRRLWDGPNARLFRRLINSSDAHPYCRGCYFLYSGS